MLDRVDREVECDYAVATLRRQHAPCVNARQRLAETVLRVRLALADGVDDDGVIDRVDGQHEGHDAVAAPACLEVLNVIIDRRHGVRCPYREPEPDIDLAVTHVVVNGQRRRRVHRERQRDCAVAAVRRLEVLRVGVNTRSLVLQARNAEAVTAVRLALAHLIVQRDCDGRLDEQVERHRAVAAACRRVAVRVNARR